VKQQDIEKFFKSVSERKLLKISTELAQNKMDGIVKTFAQIMIDEYAIDPIYATTVVRNQVNSILSHRYVKLKQRISRIRKLKNRKNESKKS